MLPRSVVLALTTDDGRRAQDSSLWPVDTAYWLGHCHGFRVDGPDGRVGVVEYVVYESRIDRPDVVCVRLGGWRSRAVSVPVADVIELRPEQARLLVRGHAGAPQPEGSGRRGWRAWTAAWGGSPT